MNKTIASYGRFRVYPITTLDSLKDLSKGAEIEYQCADDSYVVIAFVTPDKDGYCSYESVGSRIETYCTTWEDIEKFRYCLKIAYSEVTKAWREEHRDRAWREEHRDRA